MEGFINMKLVYVALFLALLSSGCGKLDKNGKDGLNGSPGSNGTNATHVYTVQLCPNQPHTSYPTNFPEMAICIDSTLYGVYNGTIDYLAELPPGDYVSIAPTGCNLTILANCQVNQQ